METPETTDVTENEDGTVTVKLPETVQAEGTPEEVFNLLPGYVMQAEIDPEVDKFLKDLSGRVMDDFKDDWDSCSTWREKRKRRTKLIVGDLDPKDAPFDGCANIHVPVMLERVLRLMHRIYAEMFPDRDFVFNVIPSRSVDRARADLLTLHGNWQIRKDISDFRKQVRRALWEFIAHGDCFFHSYYDAALRRNRHEMLNCEDLVIPYVWKTTAVDLSDVPRKTRILRKYKYELKRLEKNGQYAQLDKVFEFYDKSTKGSVADAQGGSFEDGIDYTVRPRVDLWEGRQQPSGNSSAAPFTLLEQHTWATLPGETEERPVVITLDYKSGILVSIATREEDDPKDLGRYQKQVKEKQEYEALYRGFQDAQVKTLEAQAVLQSPEVMMHPELGQEAAALLQAVAAQPLQPPPAPIWAKPGLDGSLPEPEPVRKIPIEQFSHGVCIENPDGSLGMGIGLLLEPFNINANLMTDQFVDTATLSNTMTGFVDANSGLEGGEVKLQPGKFTKVRKVGQRLSDLLHIVQFPQANPQLLDMVKLQLTSADGVSSAPEVLSGEPGKANETFRGIATRVEQALKQLTVLAMNFLEFLSQVMRNNARLNAVFLPDWELVSVVDPRTQQSKDIEVTRALYLDDMEVAFTADTRFSSRAERIAEADQVITLAAQAVPPPLLPMVFKPIFFREAVARALAARGLQEMVQFLKTPEEMAAEEQRQQMMAQMQAQMAPPPGAGGPGGQPPEGPEGPPQGGIPGPGGQEIPGGEGG